MSKQNYSKVKGRRKSPTFTMLLHRVLDSENYAKLSARAVKLLIDTSRQYNGKNNGDLCITASLMRKRGWTSKDQLQKAILELEHYGFLIRTRQGGRNMPTLFALSFHAIDECGGKHDLKASQIPPNYWQIEQKDKPVFVKTLARNTGQPSPHYGLMGNSNVVKLTQYAGQSQ